MPPFVIAELSGNHNGNINRAFQLIEAAKNSGANAVKLQTYTADTLTIDCDESDFLITQGPWAGYNLYKLYQEAHTPWEWHPELFKKAKELDVEIFSSPFDETAVDYLEQLGVSRYKIASFEIVHLPLIKYVAQTKKPMIISTGMADLEEISDAVEVALTNGCSNLTLLHCVSSYPAVTKDCNLLTMVDIKKHFPRVRIGLSDHTLGATVSVAAVALGAEVIEKHITLARSEGGVDSAFSLEPHEFKELCKATHDAWLSLGKVNYLREEAERENKIFRRSIYAIEDIKFGEPLTKDNIRIIRPGFGMNPKFFDKLLGTKADRVYKRGEKFKLQ